MIDLFCLLYRPRHSPPAFDGWLFDDKERPSRETCPGDRELGFEEPVTTDEAIRRTIAWEQANPPTGATFHRFDYDAEDAALI